jgi:hypothetical protein
MLTFLKTVAVIACFVALVPLFVWAGSGSRQQAWIALRQYLLVMGLIAAPALLVTAITLIPQLF